MMDSISEAIGTATGVFDKETKIMEDTLAEISQLDDDRDFVRKNIRTAIENASTMLPGLVALAKIAESPNLYNSATQFLDTFVDLNKALIDIGIKVDKHEASKSPSGGKPETPLLTDESSSGLVDPNAGQGAFQGTTEDFLDFVLSQMKGKTEKVSEVVSEVKKS